MQTCLATYPASYFIECSEDLLFLEDELASESTYYRIPLSQLYIAR